MTERLSNNKSIEYPYMPEQGRIEYVSADHELMVLAKEYAKRESLDHYMPNCSIVVRGDEILGIAANGSDYHDLYGCERKRLGSPTGQDYDKCDGCNPKNHGEPKAINDALQYLSEGESLEGAEIYLWGHWWCCEPCWNSMLSNGINTVYLVEGSEVLFDRDKPGNIIGRQFEQ